jgi:hypothetical protein
VEKGATLAALVVMAATGMVAEAAVLGTADAAVRTGAMVETLGMVGVVMAEARSPRTANLVHGCGGNLSLSH